MLHLDNRRLDFFSSCLGLGSSLCRAGRENNECKGDLAACVMVCITKVAAESILGITHCIHPECRRHMHLTRQGGRVDILPARQVLPGSLSPDIFVNTRSVRMQESVTFMISFRRSNTISSPSRPNLTSSPVRTQL